MDLSQITEIHLVNENSEFIIVPISAIKNVKYRIDATPFGYIQIDPFEIKFDMQCLLENFNNKSVLHEIEYDGAILNMDYLINFFKTRTDLAQIEIHYTNKKIITFFPKWADGNPYENNSYQTNTIDKNNIIVIKIQS